jgi:hypothetical protein
MARQLTAEEVWRRKSDGALLAASGNLADYTEDGQRIILAELERRRQAGLIEDVIQLEPPPTARDLGRDSDDPSQHPHGLFHRLWLGEVPLAETFWIWGVGVRVAIFFITAVVSERGPLALTVVLFVVQLTFWAFILVAIWRSAARYRGNRVWADLARVAVGLGVLRTVINVVLAV